MTLSIVKALYIGGVLVLARKAAASYTGQDFSTDVLNANNFFRHQHNASALAWSDEIALQAQEWAQHCQLKYQQGKHGQLFAIGHDSAISTVNAWAGERNVYDFDLPVFGEDTGHFTQVVWKASYQIGCGFETCPDGLFVVCNYKPPGNIVTPEMDLFRLNVQPQTYGRPDDTFPPLGEDEL